MEQKSESLLSQIDFFWSNQLFILRIDK